MIWFLNFGWTIVGSTHDLIIECLIWKAKKILICCVVQCTFPCSIPVWLHSWVSTVRYCNCVVVILRCVPNFLQYRQVRGLLFYSHFEYKIKFRLTVIYRLVYKSVKASVKSSASCLMNELSRWRILRLALSCDWELKARIKETFQEDKDFKFYLNYIFIFI